jgi:hypothetical protein
MVMTMCTEPDPPSPPPTSRQPRACRTVSRRLTATAVLLAALALAARPASSQTARGFAINRFSPSGGGSDWFALESLDFRGHFRPTGGVTFDWADEPLAITDRSGASTGLPIVDAQVFLHVGLALMLLERVRIGLSLPVAIHQSGNQRVLGDFLFRAPSRKVMGDVRLAGDTRLHGGYGDLLQLAAGLEILLPSGVRSQYTGDGVVRVAPRLLAAGQRGQYVYALRLGFQTRESIPERQRQTIRLGHELLGGLALGLRPLQKLLIGAEVYGSSVVTGGNFLRESVSPLEVMLSARLEPLPRYHVMLGVAPGMTSAIGSPSLRLVARIEYLPAW